MKTKLKIVIAASAAVALIAQALPARAQSSQSFNATNDIETASQLISDPTNNTGILTGTGIRVDNYTTLGFYWSGSNAAANSSVAVIKLVRSGSGNSPGVNANARTWENTPVFTLTLATPATAGPFYCYTNLDATVVGSATWIGIQSITNTTASGSVKFSDMGVTKKLVPIRYP